MDVTGPLWWSESIIKYLGAENINNLFDIYKRKTSEEIKNKITSNKIVFYLDQLEKGGTPNYSIYFNLLGSENNFYGDGYQSWYGRY